MNEHEQTAAENFSFTSSVAADVFHEKPNAEAYEWWYFDALSEDGRDAVVIIFLDNFIFSPRYNRSVQSSKFKVQGLREIQDSKFKIQDSVGEKQNSALRTPHSAFKNFPAVAFTYYRDGKPKYRAINEFAVEAFSASAEKPECRIGENFFRLERAPYGLGYVVSINQLLRKNLRLRADFEWLSIESDFAPDRRMRAREKAHSWNLAVARADVTGRIAASGDSAQKNSDIVHFRGTGYHDHNFDDRWLPETVSDWQWGRAHFADATAVFYRYKEIARGAKETTKIFVVENENLRAADAHCEERSFKRDVFGVRYPQLLSFSTEDDSARLAVKQSKTLDASFFYLRFLSEMTLHLPDGKKRETVGITEYLKPKALKHRWLDWLVNMRIGRGGKGSFLP